MQYYNENYDAEAAKGAQKRPDLRRAGGQPAPAGCHQ